MAGMITRSDTTALDLLLEKVYRDGKYDFREYKRGTITRRLERRLHATGARTYLDYMQFLNTHPEEYHRLADDLDYVRIYISHLRQKIEPDSTLPRYIITEPGGGYYFQKAV